MKKRYFIIPCIMLLTNLSANTAFAGQWIQDNGWKYQNDDSTFSSNGWQWINQKCYYFTSEGYCLINTTTPDGFMVDESGAWIVDGVVQVQTQTQVQTEGNGWSYENGKWKYYIHQNEIQNTWRTIDGTRYYFDCDGNMTTGMQNIEGDNYFFNEDGSLRTFSFTQDGIYYVVNSKGVITDEIDEFDWFSLSYDDSYDSFDIYDEIIDESGDDIDKSDYSDLYGSAVDIDTDAYAYEVFEIVNQERSKEKLSLLEWDSKIAECAQVRAYELVEIFSHTRPDDTSCVTILDENGVAYSSWGENIAWGQPTPDGVMDAWMHSTGHKRNILKSKFKYMGVGCVNVNNELYWVQLFTN